MDSDDLKAMLRRKEETEAPSRKDYLSTGSTLLNLGLTGRYYGGFKKGTYNLIVGDSSAGKTVMSLGILAEASINPEFEDYQLVYDDSEGGAGMSFEEFYGPAMHKRVAPIAGTKDEPEPSKTLEEFYYNLDDVLKRGPAVVIEDSMDVLTTEEEDEKFDERKKAKQKGKKTTGTYATSKPKMNSSYLRSVISKLKKSGSILILLAQTRDSFGFGSQFNPKTRAGGHALKFYAQSELWLSRYGTIKEQVLGKKRQLGIKTLIKIKKNRYTGKEREVVIPIYHSFGIDDIGSCVEFLVEEGHWKVSGGRVNCKEFDVSLSQEKLCQYIDKNNKKKKLKKITLAAWNRIEDACKLIRRNPYAVEE